MHVELKVPGVGKDVFRKVVRTLREGEALERQVRSTMIEGTFGQKPAQTIADFASRFMEWSTLHNKPSTVAAKEVALRVHLLPALGHLRLDAADLRAEVEAFTTKQRATGLAAKTVNNQLAVLAKLLSLAAERGLVQSVPKAKKLKSPNPDFDFLTFEEAAPFLTAAEPKWRALVVVLLRTGLRVGEALALKWKDVDLTNGSLRIRATRWNGQEGTPKSGAARSVPLSGDALAALKVHRHLRTYVFSHDDGRPFTHSELKDVVPNTCRRAGLAKRLTNHGLRHTCCSHLVMHGVNLVEVKEWMGHADIATTMRYAHLAPGRLKEAAPLLDLPAPKVTAT